MPIFKSSEQNTLSQPLLLDDAQAECGEPSTPTHFKKVSDIIGVIFELIQINDEKKTFLNFRAINRKFYECVPTNTLAFIASLKLLKMVSEIPNYQEAAVISKPFCQPIITTISSLKIVTTALKKDLNPAELAAQLCFPDQKQKHTTASDSFKELCDAIATNENQTMQFKSNCSKFCRNLILFTGTCAIIGAALFYLGLIAAAIADSEGARRMIKQALPKNMTNLELIISCLALFLFVVLSCVASTCLTIPLYSSIKNILRYAKGDAYDAYDRKLKTFTKKEVGMFKFVSDLLNTAKTTRIAIAAEIAQPARSSS